MDGSVANAIPAVGSRISLISSGDIRYEGILYSIDMVESKIALQQVKSYGTEGRRVGEAQVPPSEEVYEYIVFRGSDIKELNVIEYARPRGLDDPAIISAVGPGGSIGGGARPPPGVNFGDNKGQPAPTINVTPQGNQGGYGGGGYYNRGYGGRGRRGGYGGGYRGRGYGGYGYNNYRGRGGYGRGGYGGQQNRNLPPPVSVPQEDFNFDENLAKFNKDDVAKVVNSANVDSDNVNAENAEVQQDGNDATVTTGKYTKDDFFDTMSCEALEKMHLGGNTNEPQRTFAEQRKVDLETFGGLARDFRGRGRGRWGGRGRGRGGYGYGNYGYNNYGYNNYGGGYRGRGRGRGRGRY